MKKNRKKVRLTDDKPKRNRGGFLPAGKVCRNNVKNVSRRPFFSLTNPSHFFIAV
ncbi:Hypothetical protein ACI5QL_00273 [Bacillus velezensis]